MAWLILRRANGKGWPLTRMDGYGWNLFRPAVPWAHTFPRCWIPRARARSKPTGPPSGPRRSGVNAGSNQPWMEGAIDLNGTPRILYLVTDMGAFETLIPPSGTLILIR